MFGVKGRVYPLSEISSTDGFEECDPSEAGLRTALVRATPNSLWNLFSASKLVTAMLIHLLDEQRLLHLDDRVSDYVPEFGTHGKEWITIRHVLTHRAGIPTIPHDKARPEILSDPEEVLSILCASKPIWRPGRRFGYHALTGGFVLAEVLQRITGKTVQEFLKEEIADKMGLDHFRYGVAPEDIDKVALNTFTGLPLPPPASTVFRKAIGVGYREGTVASNSYNFLTGVVPAGNIITTAEQACRVMEMLLQSGSIDGQQIFEAKTVTRAQAEQVYFEFDATLGVPVRYSLGFMLGAKRISIYGRNTPRAFGHLGFTNVLMWADPERNISACIMTNGKPFISPGSLRWLALIQKIASECPRDWGRGNYPR
jgi:CubicO group peptidase (beta-lactamase class C family)